MIPASPLRTPAVVVSLVLSLGSAIYLFASHRTHVIDVLPFLVLAACPLMHLLGHHGHGSRNHADGSHDERR